MIAKAVELAVGEGLTEQDIYPLTDGALLRSLIRRENPAIERLIRGVVHRQLLKRAYVLSAAEIGRNGRDELIAKYNRSIDARQQVENEIAEALGVESDQVILYCPDISLIKEARVFTLTQAGVRRLNEPLDSPPFDVKAVEDQYERLWCLYVFVPESHRDRAGKICESVFGESNAMVDGKS